MALEFIRADSVEYYCEARRQGVVAFEMDVISYGRAGSQDLVRFNDLNHSGRFLKPLFLKA